MAVSRAAEHRQELLHRDKYGVMADEFRHEGFVESVDGNMVRVRILQSSACSGCQAKSLCKVSGSKEKLIDVECSDAFRFAVAQKVYVVGTAGQGMKAVMLAFTVPLVLLLAVVIGSSALGFSDGVAAICALAVLVPYYVALFLMRGRLDRRFRFRIEE